jgi:hypothetical protein
LIKLAKGHIKYENADPQLNEYYEISFCPLFLMTKSEQKDFFSCPEINLLPEVGSRALQKILIKENWYLTLWEVVQEDNYMYCVSSDSSFVRIVIGNCIAAQINQLESE